MSGGVDSSVAASLLVRRGGATVTAYYLKIWLEDETAYMGDCPWEEDLSYARAVCADLGIDLVVVPLQREYYERVVEYALDELRAGRTPSPDIFCNLRVKFGAFFERLGGVDRVASGHYARVESAGSMRRLRRAPDPVKDQTYFLSHLTQEQLGRIEFPIGAMMKNEVREYAERERLATMNRRDSQGICFLGKIRYPEFVRHYLGEREGRIVERETGRILGTHRGFWFHTIGQRQGLGLGNGPWYVVAKEIESNTVFVSHQEALSTSVRTEFTIENVSWIEPASGRTRLTTKLRHGPDLIPCDIRPIDEAWSRLHVRLDRGDAGIAPGQFAVLYDGEYCLGGGRIVGGGRSGAEREESCES